MDVLGEKTPATERVPAITLGDPIIVAQADPRVRVDGQWQFPHIERLADGRLHVTYSVGPESPASYGEAWGNAVSSDEGQTWTLVPEALTSGGGLLLPNGDRIMSVAVQSRGVELGDLGEPAAEQTTTRGRRHLFYRLADLRQPLRLGWRLFRLRAGKTRWAEEYAHVDIPGEARQVVELPAARAIGTSRVLVFPFFWQDRMRVAPDGSLWYATMSQRFVEGGLQEKRSVLFLRSMDAGHNWQLLSDLAYAGDGAADPLAERRDGFREPEYEFLPDGSVFALMRTTDGLGVGPLYSARSTDGGHSWSQPAPFDDRGSLPSLAGLPGGVTLASYGGPGLFVRATAAPDGSSWDPRVEVVSPTAGGEEASGHSDLMALDETRALLVYSDASYPNAGGERCKTILLRRASVS